MFTDRRDAGRQLASRLSRFGDLRPVVLGMPRGGVLVAAEVAHRLGATLDMIVVRKIGCPWQPELGLGAIAEGGVRVLNDSLIRDTGIRPEELEAATTREWGELARRRHRYRGDRAASPLSGRVVILVDDGLATGYTARAAIEAIRRRGGERVILAVPVGPRDTVAAMREIADDVVVLDSPRWFSGVGAAYRDFSPTSDDEVIAALSAPPDGLREHGE